MPKIVKAKAPCKTAKNGARDKRGRFAPGNKIARGNLGQGHLMTRFRTKFFAAITDRDFAAVCRTLLDAAKSGQNWAAKLFLDYAIGPPRDFEVEQRLDRMEKLLSEAKENSEPIDPYEHETD
jgi:hypothetical protein